MPQKYALLSGWTELWDCFKCIQNKDIYSRSLLTSFYWNWFYLPYLGSLLLSGVGGGEGSMICVHNINIMLKECDVLYIHRDNEASVCVFLCVKKYLFAYRLN